MSTRKKPSRLAMPTTLSQRKHVQTQLPGVALGDDGRTHHYVRWTEELTNSAPVYSLLCICDTTHVWAVDAPTLHPDPPTCLACIAADRNGGRAPTHRCT